MVKRYNELRPFFSCYGQGDLIYNKLLSVENDKVDELEKEMKKLDSVTKSLQKNSILMSEVRLLFDSLVKDYPIMKKILGP